MNSAGRAYQWLSRSSMRLGVAASLLLHLVFGAWMVINAARAPVAPPPQPGEIWFEEPEPEPPPAPTPPEAKKDDPAPAVKKTLPKTAVRETTKKPPTGSDAPTAAAPPSSDMPRADAPRALTLTPTLPTLSERGTIAVEPSRGETIHPDDPRFDKDVIAAKEKQLVKARVDGWAEDQLADARAQNGLPHPYLMALRDAGKTGLTKLAKERGVRASGELAGKILAQRYSSAVESYGKGGDPKLGAPGQAPRLSEKLAQHPEQQAMRALAQATEMWSDLTHNKPLLTLTLEFRQSKTTESKTTIIKASVDPSFDQFVLEAWPLSIAKAGAPPDDAYRTSELRSVWEIEGWPGQTPLDKTMTYLPESGLMGVPLTKLIPGATQGFGYEFRAKLLRVY